MFRTTALKVSAGKVGLFDQNDLFFQVGQPRHELPVLRSAFRGDHEEHSNAWQGLKPPSTLVRKSLVAERFATEVSMNQDELSDFVDNFRSDHVQAMKLGRQLHAIVESSWATDIGYGIFVLGMDGRLRFQNKMSAEIFGPAQGKKGVEFLPHRMRQLSVQTTRVVLTLFQPIQVTYVVPMPDQARAFKTIKLPLFAVGGEIDGLVGITEEVGVEEVAGGDGVLDLRSTELSPTESHSRNLLMSEIEAQVSTATVAIEGLTQTQREVAMLLADGLANKQVARTLGISLRTVESHRRQIKDRLEVDSSAEMFAVLHLYSMFCKLQAPNPADSNPTMRAVTEADLEQSRLTEEQS